MGILWKFWRLLNYNKRGCLQVMSYNGIFFDRKICFILFRTSRSFRPYDIIFEWYLWYLDSVLLSEPQLSFALLLNRSKGIQIIHLMTLHSVETKNCPNRSRTHNHCVCITVIRDRSTRHL